MISLVEVANFGFFINVLCMSYLAKVNFQISHKLIFILAGLSYFRVSILWTFFAVFSGYLFQKREEYGTTLPKLIPSIALIFPNILTTVLLRQSQIVGSNSSIFEDIIKKFKMFISAVNNSGFTSVAVTSVLVMILVSWKNTNALKFFSAYIFCCTFLFLASNSILYASDSKYLIEVIAPIYFGSVLGLQKLFQKLIFNRIYFACITFVAMMLNIVGIHQSGKLILDYKERYIRSFESVDSGRSILPLTPYPYSESLGFIREQNLPNCLFVGAVYSVFPEILEGSTLKEVANSKKLRNKFLQVQFDMGENWLDVSDRTLKLSGVSCVVLSAMTNQSLIIKRLVTHNWRLIREIRVKEYGTSIAILRSNDFP
jgi:hypothetical protein